MARPTPQHAIGVDLGGTKTAAGVVTAGGSVVFAETVPTPSREGGPAVIAATAGLVRSLLRRAAAEGIAVSEMGIGSAGVIDAAAGVVVSATDAISGWAGTPLAAELADGTGLRTAAVNDVHAHALGEAWTGAAAGTSSSLLVAFGTGVGGSFIEGGRPLLGRHWVAGHAGHIASPYAYDGGTPLPCVCGGVGHVEAIAAGPALHQAYLRLGGSSAEDARAVARLAHAGDALAGRALETAARSAGQAAGGLANVLDPEAVIVTGGLAGAGPLWWEAMEAAFRAELMPPLRDLPLRAAALGGAAAIIGAAGLVLRAAQPVPLEATL